MSVNKDYWIIPQMTKKAESNNQPFDDQELKSRSGQKVSFKTKTKYYGLSQENDSKYIGDIEDILEFCTVPNLHFACISLLILCAIYRHPKCGYVEDEDYFFEEAKAEQLDQQIYSMIARYHEWNTKEQRGNRYIFIIDRRDPENVKNNNLAKPPVVKGNKEHKDKIFMIAPKQYHDDENEQKERLNTFCKIPKKYDAFPESCLSLSKGFVLYNPASSKSLPITLDDALNGYKFAFSYHSLAQNQINAYFYHNSGGTLFDLKDIEWSWSGWFDKIDGKEQTLPSSLSAEIERVHDALPNAEFEAFEKAYREEFDVVTTTRDQKRRSIQNDVANHSEEKKNDSKQTPLDSFAEEFHGSFKQTDIYRAFTNKFTQEIAVSIVKLFTAVVEEEFGDLDDIKDDIEDRESSEIIKYILDNLDYDQFSQNRENVQNIIANGLQLIFEDRMGEFVKQH